MQWIQAVFGKANNFIRALTKRDYRNYAIIVSGVAVVAVVSLCASGFSGGGKNKVYAVQSLEVKYSDGEAEDEELSGSELQAGLMGIVSGVNSLEEYSQATSPAAETDNLEEILAGTSNVKRNILNKIPLEKGIRQFSNIGYYAQRMVREHHMAAEDYNTLLQIVEAEATGGDLKSKILIANVVLNRVADGHFPGSIYNVVWDSQGGAAQFSPTADGRIYSVVITPDTYEAVDLALAGEDYSQGALFFVARASADNHNLEWFDGNLQPLFEYGGHEYYKFSD